MTTPTGLKNPLCVALDLDDPQRVADLAAKVGPHAGMLKVGLTAFAAGGPDVVRRVATHGPVFLDLKLHDIPAQVSGAVAAVASLGVHYVTVHASGGPEMVRAASEAAGDDVTVLAVTVLTSLDDGDLTAMNVRASVSEQVAALGESALAAGAGGLVCSPHEVGALRSALGDVGRGGPLLVVPGIRPQASIDDQKRTTTPQAALAAGADVLVVGRPITATEDPASAAAELSRVLSG